MKIRGHIGRIRCVHSTRTEWAARQVVATGCHGTYIATGRTRAAHGKYWQLAARQLCKATGPHTASYKATGSHTASIRQLARTASISHATGPHGKYKATGPDSKYNAPAACTASIRQRPAHGGCTVRINGRWCGNNNRYVSLS